MQAACSIEHRPLQCAAGWPGWCAPPALAREAAVLVALLRLVVALEGVEVVVVARLLRVPLVEDFLRGTPRVLATSCALLGGQHGRSEGGLGIFCDPDYSYRLRLLHRRSYSCDSDGETARVHNRLFIGLITLRL